MQVKELSSAAAAARWDAFVATHPDATFFHRAGWKRVFEEALGHRGYFLYTEQHGEITGVLPLGHVRTRLFGNALISQPFCVYGGVVANDEATRVVLEHAAADLARRLKVECLELRNLIQRHPEWPTKDLYVTFRKALAADPEANLLAIPRKQRAMVRKGEKAGLSGEIDATIERFYDMYSRSVHRLGTPVLTKRYYQSLKDVFGDDCEVLTILHAGAPVASVMSFYFRDEVLPYYGGGTSAARDVAGNDFMYWELMRRACLRGTRIFDYGRSKKDSGSYSFKKNWGFEPQPLYYEYQLFTLNQMPEINPNNPKYQLFIKAWQRMPYAMSTVIGPWLARGLA